MKIYKFIAGLLLLADVFLAVGLYQPFQPLQMQATIQFTNPVLTVLQAGQHRLVYPTPDLHLMAGMEVDMQCQLGYWLPVIFDCTNTLLIPTIDTPQVEF